MTSQRTIDVLSMKFKTLVIREKIIDSIRSYFKKNDFLEVETPLRIKSPAPELNIDPEPSGNKFLIASPELQMKKLVATGYNKIFQIGKCFRKGEKGQHHLPEFTMLEWYEKDASLNTLKNRCQGFITEAARNIEQFPSVEYGETNINLEGQWTSILVEDAFQLYAGWKPGPNPDSFKFDIDLVEKIEPSLPKDKPVFLEGYPRSLASLAKINPQNPNIAQRMELYMGGLEIGNGFEELTDADEQLVRFEKEEKERRQQKKPPFEIDMDFINALKHGLPPCAGMAVGIDRLIMVLTNNKNIKNVVTFS